VLEASWFFNFTEEEKECIKQLNTNEDKIKTLYFRFNTPENDTEFNNFMECVWKKLDFQRENGDINYEKLKNSYQLDRKTGEDNLAVLLKIDKIRFDAVTKCESSQAMLKSDTAGETVVKVQNCIVSHYLEATKSRNYCHINMKAIVCNVFITICVLQATKYLIKKFNFYINMYHLNFQVLEASWFFYFTEEEKQCIKQLDADEEKIENLYTKYITPENDTQFNNFMECVWKKSEFLTDNGGINYKKLKNSYQIDRKTGEDNPAVLKQLDKLLFDAVSKCESNKALLKADTAGEIVVKVQNCIVSNFLEASEFIL
ncbi:hypothetical protein ILUMI_17020, partial [Ignelater luminosus]